jgi:predicted ABC-type ATPase
MMRPSVIVLAGPNGAGKTTAAPEVLRAALHVGQFVNADVIAQGLSGFLPETAALEAGRIMLARLHDLAREQESFSFETTLASRSFASWIEQLLMEGYIFHLFFFWLPSPEMAIARVAQRVQLGGHFVDDQTIRRRYDRGLQNFFCLYRSIATTWAFYDNAAAPTQKLVASGAGKIVLECPRPELWQQLRSQYDPETST